MHVSRNRSAQRDEARAGRDRRKKSARQKNIDQLRDRHPGLASQQPGGRIEREHPIEPGQINDAILIVKRRIAISPPGPPRNQRGRIRRHHRPQLGNSIRPINIALRKRIPPPPGERRTPRIRQRGRSRRHKKNQKQLKLTGSARTRNVRQARTSPTLYLARYFYGRGAGRNAAGR